MEQLMSPKSPLPGLADFHGKRKQMVKIQVLEREIGLLQEELKSLEGLYPASRCCKELDAFVGSISDPFTLTRKHTMSESYHFTKQIRNSMCDGERKTIQNIKEITNNHNEEDKYSMLKECSMIPMRPFKSSSFRYGRRQWAKVKMVHGKNLKKQKPTKGSQLIQTSKQ